MLWNLHLSFTVLVGADGISLTLKAIYFLYKWWLLTNSWKLFLISFFKKKKQTNKQQQQRKPQCISTCTPTSPSGYLYSLKYFQQNWEQHYLLTCPYLSWNTQWRHVQTGIEKTKHVLTITILPMSSVEEMPFSGSASISLFFWGGRSRKIKIKIKMKIGLMHLTYGVKERSWRSDGLSM